VKYVETTVTGDEGLTSAISRSGVISMGCDALASQIPRTLMKSHPLMYVIIFCCFVDRSFLFVMNGHNNSNVCLSGSKSSVGENTSTSRGDQVEARTGRRV
jgi:hypothetical protein